MYAITTSRCLLRLERLLAELELSTRSSNGCFEDGGTHNPWIRPLVILAIETAMRRGELLSLRWSDVFIADCFVRLNDTKNDESRNVPLSIRAHNNILTNLPRHISGRVFSVTADAVKKVYVRAVERAGLVDLHFHDLRHEAPRSWTTCWSYRLSLATRHSRC